MTQSHVTKVFAIKTAKIYAVTKDVTGAATTYAAGIQVVGMQEVMVTETWKESYLRGDNTLLDYETTRDTVKLTIKHAKLNLDVVAILTGSTIADTGTTPNQVTKNTYAPADVPGYWKLDAECVSVDGTGGDLHIVVGKAKIGGSRAFGLAEEDFERFQFEAVAVPPLGTGSVWYQEVLNETAAAPA